MLGQNPDKFIRKYFAESITGVPVYDGNTVDAQDRLFVVLTNQNKIRSMDNKCYTSWDCTINIEIIERSLGTANKGSRVKINDLENTIIMSFNSLQISNFDIIHKEYESNSLVTQGITQVIDRQIITINLKLKENGSN